MTDTIFQKIENRPGAYVIRFDPDNWKAAYKDLAARSFETCWGFATEEQMTLGLCKALEAAEIELAKLREQLNEMKGLRMANGRLQKQVDALKKKGAK